MPLRFNIHNAAGRYSDALTDCIAEVVQRAETSLSAACPLPLIDLTVFLSSNNIHPDYCMTGMMMAKDSCYLIINPDHARFAEDGDAQLFSSVIHEIHHCLREAHHPFGTLADNLVNEGLAMAAERYMDCSTKIWDADRPSPRALRPRLARVAADPLSTDFVWIYRPVRGKRINLIYYLGDEIVRSWLEETGETAFTAMATPALDILAQSPALIAARG
jgi:uncharacterized protein YjaZ